MKRVLGRTDGSEVRVGAVELGYVGAFVGSIKDPLGRTVTLDPSGVTKGPQWGRTTVTN